MTALWLLGRFSGGRGALHDVVTGAQVYSAQRVQEVVRRHRSLRAPSSRLAFALSIFPGIGLMYSGRIWLGLLFLIAIPATFPRFDDDPGIPVGLWLASGIVAAVSAARQARRAESDLPPIDPEIVRRQES